MFSPHELSGAQGKDNWQKITSPHVVPLPNQTSMGQTYNTTSFNNQAMQIASTDVRWAVQIYDNGGGIVDSNGYYVVCKYDQWFSTATNNILMPMRLNSSATYQAGDIIWAESYSVTTSSPNAVDDNFLLCHPLQKTSLDCSAVAACLNTSQTEVPIVETVCSTVGALTFVVTDGNVTDVKLNGTSILGVSTNVVLGVTEQAAVLTLPSAVVTLGNPFCFDTSINECCLMPSCHCVGDDSVGAYPTDTVIPNVYRLVASGFVGADVCLSLNGVHLLHYQVSELGYCSWVDSDNPRYPDGLYWELDLVPGSDGASCFWVAQVTNSDSIYTNSITTADWNLEGVNTFTSFTDTEPACFGSVPVVYVEAA